MKLERAFCLVLAALLAACGGGGHAPTTASSVAPPPTTTPAPVVQDGWSGQPVAADVQPPSPSAGASVTVRAPGYFVREQRFGGSPIFLWPTDDESYVRELVYDWDFADGTHRIVRWTRGFKVSLDGDLADSETLVAKVQETVAELVRTTGLPITVGPGGECLILIDPNILEDDNAIAETTYAFQGPTIVGSRVLFATRREIAGGAGSDYRNTLLHEMGHVLGLGHSPDSRDVMTPSTGPGSKVGQFQPREEVSLRMMYLRRQAGNIFPDRDVALGAASSRAWTARIIDRR